MKTDIIAFFQNLQDSICTALEIADGTGRFREDAWQRPGGGGGRSRTLSGGAIIEKGGVGFSAVYGRATEGTLRQLHIAPDTQAEFFAAGVSIVLHPHNPMVPIIHMNVRYFEMSTGQSWFGGGIDLTPHYVVEADARWFHGQLRAVCDRHEIADYQKFKTWADDYFFIRHRQETRGIGGIFFDTLTAETDSGKAGNFAFVQDVGNAFAPIYTQFMAQNHRLPFSEREKSWQNLRRGRYVEFNLVWDRGTKFGLETDGRTESILMSMPPVANWVYDFRPESGSREEETLAWLRKGVGWI